MINVSNEYRSTIMENRRFHLRATLTFPDNTVFELDDSDIFENGMTFDEATSDRNSLQIGFAYIGSHKLILDNFDGKFDDYDFTGATVIPYVGLQLSESIEYLKKGFYTVDDMGTGGNIITLSCFDNMNKFARPFSDVTITFPTSAQFLLTTICNHCGVPLSTTTFSNDDYIINERPIDEALTCLDMISFIGQVTGNFAKCNINGALELKWYDLSAFEETDNLDGGKFDDATPYSSGDNADGGNFTNYSSGDNKDGGTFLQTKRYHHFYNFSTTPTISVDDVVITGIKVIYEQDDDAYSKLFGANGYVLSIEDNPLIQSQSDADIVANIVGAKIVGMRLRPFSANILSDPSVQAGDACKVSIRTSRGYADYPSFVASLAYTVGQRMMVSGDAETASRNNSTRYSAETKAIVEARKLINNEKSSRQIAIDELNDRLTNSSGLYNTEEEKPDGSKISYSHDKPTLAESSIVWKFTAEAIGLSTDGGITYPYGLTIDGNVIANILETIGINAEWIKVLTTFAVGDDFAVDSLGHLTSKSGEIGPFRLDERGFFSKTISLYENANYPLLWMTQPDEDLTDDSNGYTFGGEGSAMANYEPSVSALRKIENGIRTEINLIARTNPEIGASGTITIDKYDASTNQRISGYSIADGKIEYITYNSNGVIVENFELSKNGLFVDNFDTGKNIMFMFDTATGGLVVQGERIDLIGDVYINGTLQ